MSAAEYILIGAFVGIIVGWVLRALRPARPNTLVENELRLQRAAQDAELARLRNELTHASSARAAAEAGRQAIEAASQKSLTEFRAERDQINAALNELREQLAAQKKRVTESEAELRFTHERLATERQQINVLQEKFHAAFEAVSNKLLVDNSSRFNQQSAESLEKLLAPFKETLGEFKGSLESTRKETATHSALLRDQISRVGAEAANLTKALKGDAKVLGNWGENMLEQILEKSGLQRDLHYRRQQSAKDIAGDQRFLDVIVELPEKRNLVIDSKVSLRSYEEAFNSPDDAAREILLTRHVDAMRVHIRALGAKRYHELHGINTPDFVLMYVPIEGAFFAAVARDATLFGDALDHNVVLITNSTLLATLRTVAHVWRLAEQQKHAVEIADRGGRLYDKFVGFVDDLQQASKALKNCQDSLDAAAGKLHLGPGNLIRQAEQMKILGAKAAKSLPPDLVEKSSKSDPALPETLST